MVPGSSTVFTVPSGFVSNGELKAFKERTIKTKKTKNLNIKTPITLEGLSFMYVYYLFSYIDQVDKYEPIHHLNRLIKGISH